MGEGGSTMLLGGPQLFMTCFTRGGKNVCLAVPKVKCRSC